MTGIKRSIGLLFLCVLIAGCASRTQTSNATQQTNPPLFAFGRQIKLGTFNTTASTPPASTLPPQATQSPTPTPVVPPPPSPVPAASVATFPACAHSTPLRPDCRCAYPQQLTMFCTEGFDSARGYCADPNSMNYMLPVHGVAGFDGRCAYASDQIPKTADSYVTPEFEAAHPNCEFWCLGKPVIYLYPPSPTLVDVFIHTPGQVIISDPQYPSEGWQDVLAFPDGTLHYQRNHYHELYYETDVADVKPPSTGLVIPTPLLRPVLTSLTMQLGLVDHEQDEFLAYWLPKLEALNSPYILFSVIDSAEKERVDGVQITPKPDTFIGFLAYFKPVDHPIAVSRLSITPPPARTGFTAVEWGGTIDPRH